MAKADGEQEDGDLTLICVISIRDNVRKEAINAINEVQGAGIQVVMVTGDRHETALTIANEVGLLNRQPGSVFYFILCKPQRVYF